MIFHEKVTCQAAVTYFNFEKEKKSCISLSPSPCQYAMCIWMHVRESQRQKRKACIEIEKGEMARDDDGKSKRKGSIINTKGGKHLYKDKSTVFLISHAIDPLPHHKNTQTTTTTKNHQPLAIHSFFYSGSCLALPCLALVSLQLFHHIYSCFLNSSVRIQNTKSKKHPENQSIQLQTPVVLCAPGVSVILTYLVNVNENHNLKCECEMTNMLQSLLMLIRQTRKWQCWLV